MACVRLLLCRALACLIVVLRKHAFKVGVLAYYVETKIHGHKKSLRLSVLVDRNIMLG